MPRRRVETGALLEGVMTDELEKYETSAGCESNTELNKDASYRNAPMISGPGTILKRRIRGALIPMRKVE
jgi:hypothetical protein